MKKIAILMILAYVGLIFLSCATSPYTIQRAANKELLSQDTVILEVGMAPRFLQVLPLLDAGIYNAGVKSAEEALGIVERAKLQSMNERIAREYAEVYNANIVTSDFPFEGDKITLEYFSKASPATVEHLVRLCEENGAEIIVTIMGQIVCTKVAAFGINGQNQMDMIICIFNKEGQIIAQGKVNSPIRAAPATDIASYGILFEEGIAYCTMLLREIASSK
jgi:hypothetical protein